MSHQKIHLKLSFCTILILAMQIAIPQYSQALGVKRAHSKCYINVGYAHISTYFKKFKDHYTVKVNAYSKCDQIMEDVTLIVELKKKGLITDHLVSTRKALFPGFSSINQKLWNKKTFSNCKNAHPTTYYGVAYAEGKINGKSFKTVKTYSDIFRVLDCGT